MKDSYICIRTWVYFVMIRMLINDYVGMDVRIFIFMNGFDGELYKYEKP